jgi:putative tricarboxylic transport membrane protein
MNTPLIDRRQVLGRLAGASLLPALPLMAQAQTPPPWKPTQTITYGIGVAPGGSVDLYARGIKNALETLNLVNGQIIVTDNKPGAGGLIALQQLQRSRGNAHNLGTFHTGSLAGQVTGILKADMREFVPVAMLVEETTLVAVRTDSPFKTAKDLVAALKRDPGSVKIAVAPLKGLNTHLAIAKPLKVAGIDITKLTVVPFRSSADSMSALLGGHVDVVSATGPTVVPMAQAGKVRMLVSAAPVRGTGPLAAVPTWREQGCGRRLRELQRRAAAPAVDAEQIRFWEQALRQVAASKDGSRWSRSPATSRCSKAMSTRTATCRMN